MRRIQDLTPRTSEGGGGTCQSERAPVVVCLLDNRVVGGQIGVIGWGGETRLDDGRIRGMQDARPDPKIFLIA